MRQVQRYRIYEQIASGGMGTVNLGTLVSEGRFSKVAAIKIMHAMLADDPDFRAMFLDEARMVAHIRHSNVVSTLDVLAEGSELFLVMEYVPGPSVSMLLRRVRERGELLPISVALAIAQDMLAGLHAAHEARSAAGAPLGIVHRDVSPHNLLLGSDGVARVMDFGIATAADRMYSTRTGEVKGKMAYMPPEQARGEKVDRRADVFSAATVLYELLVGKTPFGGGAAAETMFRLLLEPVPSLLLLREDVPLEIEAIISRALSKTPDERFSSAREMAEALRLAAPHATPAEVGALVMSAMPDFFEARNALVARMSEAPAEAPSGPAVGGVAPPREIMVEEGTVAGAVLEEQRPGRAWLLLGAAMAVAVLVGGSLGVARYVRGRSQIDVAAVVASVEPASAPSAAPSAPAPTFTTSTDSTPSSAPPVRTNSPRGRPATTASTGGRSVSPPQSAQPVAPTTPPPQCCIQLAGRWQRYSLRADCVNNCPADLAPQ